MKRTIAILIALMMVASMAIAAPRGSVETLFDGVLINATATSASDPVRVSSSGVFGVYYTATSVGGTADVKLEVQMSYDATAANFVEPDGLADIVTNLTDEAAHVKGIYPPPMRYMRILCTGNGGNPADTLLTLYLFKQE